MPNEAEKVLLPYNADNALLLPEIDKLIRYKTNIEKVLKITNQIIFREHFGLTQKEIKLVPQYMEKTIFQTTNQMQVKLFYGQYDLSPIENCISQVIHY